MKLTQYSNYALRTLMFANLHSERLCQCQEVADAFNISKAHLVKCVHQLGQWGFIQSVRGRNGGFRLAKPARDITVGAVIRKTEDTLELVECFNSETNTCPLISDCKLNKTLMRAMKNFMDEMDSVTIEDITSNQRELLDLLKV
jgi:Rrf2 family nitric oxide-sensitive transcriptional repressor